MTFWWFWFIQKAQHIFLCVFCLLSAVGFLSVGAAEQCSGIIALMSLFHFTVVINHAEQSQGIFSVLDLNYWTGKVPAGWRWRTGRIPIYHLGRQPALFPAISSWIREQDIFRNKRERGKLGCQVSSSSHWIFVWRNIDKTRVIFSSPATLDQRKKAKRLEVSVERGGISWISPNGPVIGLWPTGKCFQLEICKYGSKSWSSKLQFLKWLPPPNNKPANPHRFQIKMHNFTAECNL